MPKKMTGQIRIDMVHSQYAAIFRDGAVVGFISDRTTAEYLNKLLGLQTDMDTVRGKLADFLATTDTED